tara:strand:+ start:519 stop:983 length:465 start_codon:yes stop_codon:yes gene_type:complete
MVTENILEFEKKHSKNLIELNEWLDRIKDEQSNYQEIPDKEPLSYELKFLIEDSKLYKETGKLQDCDPLYEKMNKLFIADMSHLKVLACYLTNDELKDRLSYENYMLLETEVIIDRHLTRLEDKITRKRVAELRQELKETEAKLKNPSMNKKSI